MGMSENEIWKLALAFFVACFTAVVYLWKKRNVNKSSESEVETEEPVDVPKNWVKAGNVKKLILYPIKSCGGIEMQKAITTPYGLQGRKGSKVFRDRVFLVVDGKGREICQGKSPRLVLISVAITDDDKITLNAPDMKPITFSIPENNEKNRVLCHLGKSDKNLIALDCGDAVAEWYVKFLHKPSGIRLVYYIEGFTKEQRQLTPDQKLFPTFKTADLGVFQNESSYLLIAQESIEQLDQQMSVRISHKNFRPTVLVENIKAPFIELKWTHAKIGDRDACPILKTGRPCDRCSITTNDPETGVMDTTRELLKTLKMFDHEYENDIASDHMKEKSVMGLRMGLLPTFKNKNKRAKSDENFPEIQVGDAVYIPAPECQG